MTGEWDWLLLLVFVTHAPFFAWRWWRTREPRHGATTTTFLLLVAAYSLRVFAREWSFGEVPAHAAVRAAALASAVVSIGWLLLHWGRRLVQSRSSPS